jgi:amino acid transporter
MFSMARLPFSKQLAHVSPRRGTPARPNIVVGGLAIALLVVKLGQSALFTDITGVAVVVVYLAYLGVTVPRLVSRFKPGFAEREWASGEHFSLDRFGLPLNVIAVVFGTFFLIDIGWRRAVVYGNAGYLHYFSLIFVAGCAALGTSATYGSSSATTRSYSPSRRRERCRQRAGDGPRRSAAPPGHAEDIIILP